MSIIKRYAEEWLIGAVLGFVGHGWNNGYFCIHAIGETCLLPRYHVNLIHPLLACPCICWVLFCLPVVDDGSPMDPSCKKISLLLISVLSWVSYTQRVRPLVSLVYLILMNICLKHMHSPGFHTPLWEDCLLWTYHQIWLHIPTESLSFILTFWLLNVFDSQYSVMWICLELFSV